MESKTKKMTCMSCRYKEAGKWDKKKKRFNDYFCGNVDSENYAIECMEGEYCLDWEEDEK